MGDGISIAYLIKKSERRIREREEQIQELVDRRGGRITDPETGVQYTAEELKKQIHVWDHRALEELQRGTLPQPLHDAILTEIWTQGNKAHAEQRQDKARVSKQQTERAKRPRAPALLSEIIARLAREQGTAKQLWPELIGSMDAEGMEPKEVESSCSYLDENEKPRTISLKTFSNRLSAARIKYKSR